MGGSTLECRLITDEPAPGAWNMAVDEAILLEAIANPKVGPTFRWYRWSPATLSLGYFQSAAEIPANFAKVDTVRRVTGGGAILHDQEITYSIVFPSETWPKPEFIDMVKDVHEAVANVLAGLAMSGTLTPAPFEPYLCFERRHPNDLVYANHKIVGSAQRKQGGALLQHGSILLEASAHVPHLLGIRNFIGAPDAPSVARDVLDELSKKWDWHFVPGTLTEAERTTAQKLAKEKYSTTEWNEKR